MVMTFPLVEAESLQPKAMSSNCLPYGETLHYTDCSCPSSWVPGTRACDAVDTYVQQAFASIQQGLVTPMRKLKVLFCLPHHNITGGMKMLVEQIRLLRSRGHHVIAVMRSDTAERAMPPWTTIEADEDVVCRLTERMDEVCDTRGVDVVLIGIFHQVAEWMLASSAPVVYWEQGHEWLFGDPVRFQEVHNYKRQDQLFHQVMHLPCAMAAVSEAVQNILSQEFGRSSLLIHNGIDCERFSPGPKSTLAPTQVLTAANYVEPSTPAEQRPSVLLVGNPSLPLKGFDVGIAVLSLVNRVVPIEVTWVCQNQPKEELVPGLSSCGLKINLHISPSQDVLPSLYRGHDCFLFCSRYEAWGMPVLEAMASGVAVVTTNCLGVTSFAKPGVNCFMAGPQDLMGLMRGVLTILERPAVRDRLKAVGLTTAQMFSPDSVVGQLENVLYSLTVCQRELLQLRQPALPDIQLTALWAAHACARTPEQQHTLLHLQQQVQQQRRQQQEGGHHAASAALHHVLLQQHSQQLLGSAGHPLHLPLGAAQQQRQHHHQLLLASAGQQQQQLTLSLQRMQHQQQLALVQQQDGLRFFQGLQSLPGLRPEHSQGKMQESARGIAGDRQGHQRQGLDASERGTGGSEDGGGVGHVQEEQHLQGSHGELHQGLESSQERSLRGQQQEGVMEAAGGRSAQLRGSFLPGHDAQQAQFAEHALPAFKHLSQQA